MLELCLYVLLACRLLCGVPLLVRASVSASYSASTSGAGVGYGRTSSRDFLLWSGKKQPRETAWAYIRRRGSLPQQPDLSSPASESWKNSVAMCTSVRWENTTDVREWVLYHRWLGFDHIFLTENAKSASKELQAQLSDFINAGFLTYSLEPTVKAQMKVFYDCARENAQTYNWLAFFDVDEFMLLRKEQTLKDVLDDYKEYAGLSLHWVVVGSGGRVTRPATGGVLRSYGTCAGKGRHMIKTIANTYFLKNVALHPHNFVFRDGMQSVDEKFEPIPFRRKVVCHNAGKDCRKDAGFMKRSAHIQRVALIHYTTKSRADYESKIARGHSNMRTGKGWPFFYNVQNFATETGGICEEPAEKGKLCCPTEQLVLS